MDVEGLMFFSIYEEISPQWRLCGHMKEHANEVKYAVAYHPKIENVCRE